MSSECEVNRMALHIVLVEPEIPANTGNIARTCAATGTRLHLVRPLGFRTDDATLKRAGLDYWYAVHIEYHDSFQEVLDQYADSRFFMPRPRRTNATVSSRSRTATSSSSAKRRKGCLPS